MKRPQFRPSAERWQERWRRGVGRGGVWYSRLFFYPCRKAQQSAHDKTQRPRQSLSICGVARDGVELLLLLLGIDVNVRRWRRNR